MKKGNTQTKAIVKAITKKKPTQKDMLMKLTRQVQKMKKQVDKKIQAWDLSNAQVGSAAGVISTLYGGIVQGITTGTRIGDKITPLYIMWRIQTNILATTIAGHGSFDLVYDYKPDGTQITVADVYNGTAPKDLPNYLPRKRFKQLHHHQFTYDTGTLSAIGPFHNGYLDLRKYGSVHFTATAGAIGDLQEGGPDLNFVFRSSNSATGSTSYGQVADIRIVFEDY